jgi:hypothetical protein
VAAKRAVARKMGVSTATRANAVRLFVHLFNLGFFVIIMLPVLTISCWLLCSFSIVECGGEGQPVCLFGSCDEGHYRGDNGLCGKFSSLFLAITTLLEALLLIVLLSLCILSLHREVRGPWRALLLGCR